MRSILLTLAVATLLPMGPAEARRGLPMTVATYLEKLDRLQPGEREMHFAYKVRDARLLSSAVLDGAYEAKRANAASQASGRRPLFCPPSAKGEISFTHKQLSDYFRGLPPDRKAMTVKAAFLGFAIMKYPCPAPAEQSSVARP